MKTRFFLLPPILLFIAVSSFAEAVEPRSEPLKASTADLLKFLGAHAWKWTYHSSTPYKQITVRLIHFTRTPSGEFKREEFCSDSSIFPDARISDEILIVCGNRNGHATFVVSFGGGTVGPNEQSNILLTNYSPSGLGDGGVPRMVGSEYVLLTEFKDRKRTNNKDDLVSYVSVEVDTK